MGSRGDWRFTKEDLLKLTKKSNQKETILREEPIVFHKQTIVALKDMKQTFGEIQQFLIKNADKIQKLATSHHIRFLGSKTLRKEYIDKYAPKHIEVVKEFANNLEGRDLLRGAALFRKSGTSLAHNSVKDGLTIEEAIDGTIFLKEAVWDLLDKEGFMDKLTAREFYHISQTIGTYCDVLVSKIAIEYQTQYQKRIQSDLVIRKKLEQQKDEFIGMVSHELKTPITSLKAYTQILQSRFVKMGDEKSATLLMKMDAQLHKLNTLIADLLDVNKMDTGKLQLQAGWFDFNELVSEIVEQMQFTTEKQTIQKELSKTITVYADRDRIGQVLVNLISNAVKYAPLASEIIVKTTSDTKQVTVSVQDFGMGIAKENQERLFERFFRVEGEKQNTYPGMGLGLYISKEIITRQGGRIWADSTLGKGSTFSFSLPIEQRRKKKK